MRICLDGRWYRPTAKFNCIQSHLLKGDYYLRRPKIMYSIYIAYFQNYAFPRLPISKIAHFQDGSMRFTHYYPGRPYDHFIDHSQLPGKRAMELPVRRVTYSFWQYRSLSIARYPLHLGGWPASGVNPRIRTHDTTLGSRLRHAVH